MAGGGVASPTDRIDSTQYSISEIEAAVEEATAANRYVTAHAYTGRAINRALRAGVRGIEHGNLLDDESLDLFKEFNAFLTMNLVAYWALEREGRKFGLSQQNWEKVAAVLDGGYEALGKAHEAGINLAYGSDLLGGLQIYQAKEFTIREKLMPAIDVIRSATTTAAALLQREGELGTIAVGAYGDFVITSEDPLKDLSVLGETRLDYVIQNGAVVKRATSQA
jgi:imidazolonepropionase-like amidohydrolase